jgi:hypothetical protein
VHSCLYTALHRWPRPTSGVLPPLLPSRAARCAPTRVCCALGRPFLPICRVFAKRALALRAPWLCCVPCPCYVSCPCWLASCPCWVRSNPVLDHALDPDPKTLTLSLSLSLGLGIRCDRIPGLARAGSGLGPDACTLTLTFHCSLAAGVTCTLHSALWQQGSRNCNPAAGVTCTLQSGSRGHLHSALCNPAAGVSELQSGCRGLGTAIRLQGSLSCSLAAWVAQIPPKCLVPCLPA